MLVWAAVAFLSTQDDARRLVDLLCGLPDEELRSTFANVDLAHGVEIVTVRIWTLELQKATEEQQWDPVLRTLDSAHSKSYLGSRNAAVVCCATR